MVSGDSTLDSVTVPAGQIERRQIERRWSRDASVGAAPAPDAPREPHADPSSA
jgi:hypothetical protein